MYMSSIQVFGQYMYVTETSHTVHALKPVTLSLRSTPSKRNTIHAIHCSISIRHARVINNILGMS